MLTSRQRHQQTINLGEENNENINKLVYKDKNRFTMYPVLF